MKVTPPLAVAPITQDDDMRWNPRSDDGIVVLFPTLMQALRARSPHITTSTLFNISSRFGSTILI